MVKTEKNKLLNEGEEYFKEVYEYTKKQEKITLLRNYLGLLRKNKPNFKRILDIGCAYGYFLKLCDELHAETYGIDISDYALSIASQNTKAALHKLNIEKQKLPYENEFFDVVTCFDVVEHLRMVNTYLKEIHRVLKRWGLLFITSPNKAFIFKSIIKDRDPTHVNVHESNYWRRKLKEKGFKNIKIKYCVFYGFPPFEKLRKTNVTWIQPFFLPISSLGQELFILAEK